MGKFTGEVLLKDNPLDDKSSIDIFGDEKEINKVMINAIQELNSNNPFNESQSYFTSSDLTEEALP